MLNNPLKTMIIDSDTHTAQSKKATVNTSNGSANGTCTNVTGCSMAQKDTQPTDEELDTLGLGCYVQVQSDNECFWVEITNVNNEVFTGTVHAELGSSPCQSISKTLTETQFTKEQVINLGCDNYCWC